MRIFEASHTQIDFEALIDDPEALVQELTPDGLNAVRLAVEGNGISLALAPTPVTESVGKFTRRSHVNETRFNAVYVVPTGVGAETGGHAGDAGATLRVLASVADHVFTHPNVCNASDINEIPENASYIEGSILSRFMMGNIGLSKARNNRCLVLVAKHPMEKYFSATVNSVNAAVCSYGFNPSKIVAFEDCNMQVSFSSNGRATGTVHNIEELKAIVDRYEGSFDAIAVCSVVGYDRDGLNAYYLDKDGSQVNPLGGIEALLSHWLSLYTNKPVAHAPMMEDDEIEATDFGVTDPRLAAEMVSQTFSQSIFKGLQRAPRIIKVDSKDAHSAEDIHALVIPQGCFGLPIIAALKQGIPVIAVNEKLASASYRDIVRQLPWAAGQYREVDNYFEAAGYLACLKAGINPRAVERPLDLAGLVAGYKNVVPHDRVRTTGV